MLITAGSRYYNALALVGVLHQHFKILHRPNL
jgi:hypothetical protein